MFEYCPHDQDDMLEYEEYLYKRRESVETTVGEIDDSLDAAYNMGRKDGSSYATTMEIDHAGLTGFLWGVGVTVVVGAYHILKKKIKEAKVKRREETKERVIDQEEP